MGANSRLQMIVKRQIVGRRYGLGGAAKGPGVGGPAKGRSIHGPGQGDGWGGPANGVWEKLIPQTRMYQPGEKPDVTVTQSSKEKRLKRQQRAERMETIIENLALNAEREETQLAAAVKLHAIDVGLPVARVINTTEENVGALTDDELNRELARLGGTEAAASTGDQAAGVSEGFRNVVH